jgi:polyphenol oxidase
MSDAAGFLTADWPAPAHICALCTTRGNGFSSGAWRALNLADHVGDDPSAVAKNRQWLARELALPSPPQWLNQVHGCAVIDAASDGVVRVGDAAYSDHAGIVCAVLTADCLPVALCDRAGTQVAVAHCGWRGLAAGVLRATVTRFRARPEDMLAWLGPAIGPRAFEVGADVRDEFLRTAVDAAHAFAIEAAFLPQPHSAGKFLADLYALARAECHAMRIDTVHGGGFCTVEDSARFYSYRRDGVTGRMATLIWIRP